MRANGDGKPVVAVDIDGTLADYHGWFLRFAELYTGKLMPDPRDVNDGKPLHQFMGLTKAQYREVKLAYRQGGMKRSMPCLLGADKLIARIRRQACLRNTMGDGLCGKHGLGAEVWVCTTRPYLRLDNIDPDTREWLRRNGIRYDALLFDPTDGDEKYRELARQAGDRVACALEDLPAQVERAFKHKVPFVFMRTQPYNKTWSGVSYQQRRTDRSITGMGLLRWDTADEAYGLVRAAVLKWRRGQYEQ